MGEETGEGGQFSNTVTTVTEADYQHGPCKRSGVRAQSRLDTHWPMKIRKLTQKNLRHEKREKPRTQQAAQLPDPFLGLTTKSSNYHGISNSPTFPQTYNRINSSPTFPPSS